MVKPVSELPTYPKVVLICASEMKEFMKMTSELLFTTRTWYEVENGSNGSCNFVFSSGPQVCSSSVPKHGVKVRIFSRDFMDKCIFTRVKTCFHPGENEVIYFENIKLFSPGWKPILTWVKMKLYLLFQKVPNFYSFEQGMILPECKQRAQ